MTDRLKIGSLYHTSINYSSRLPWISDVLVVVMGDDGERYMERYLLRPLASRYKVTTASADFHIVPFHIGKAIEISETDLPLYLNWSWHHPDFYDYFKKEV